MKKIILSCFVAGTLMSHAQTELYSDDFETVGTFIMSSTTLNEWSINNTYTGIVLPAVPSQPGTFTSPNGNYLHPKSFSLDGLDNQANYELPGNETMMAAMTTQVNTSGYNNVTLNLWRTGGLNGVKILYQVNGGGWVDSGHSFSGNPTDWQQESFVIPAGDDVAQFAIAFEFDESTASDPAPNHYHSIDEISITGDPITPPEELTASVQNPPAYYCGEEDITVDYAGTNGTYNASNEFQLELSDDAGDFTSPTVIGSIASTNATGTITGAIPMGITSGTGYRVRVVSTDNAFTGDDNGTDLTLHPKPAAPVITQNGLDLQSSYANGNQWYLDGTPLTGEENQDLTAEVSGSFTVVHTSADGCESDPSDPVIIDFTNTVDKAIVKVQIFPNPFDNQLKIENMNDFNTLNVVDVTGKTIHKQSLLNSESKINTTKWESGLYFIHLTGENTSKTIKVIKR